MDCLNPFIASRPLVVKILVHRVDTIVNKTSNKLWGQKRPSLNLCGFRDWIVDHAINVSKSKNFRIVA